MKPNGEDPFLASVLIACLGAPLLLLIGGALCLFFDVGPRRFFAVILEVFK